MDDDSHHSFHDLEPCTNILSGKPYGHELVPPIDSMFPKRYQTNRWLTGAQYWVNPLVWSEEEYRRFKPEIDAMFQQLDGMRTFHKYTETTDSQHVQQKKYIMTLPL